MDIKIRNAKPHDTNFILHGIKDIFRIQKTRLTKKKFKEIRKLTKKAMKNNEIRVVYKNNVKIGFSWFKFSNITPFGVNYGKWTNKYCWISWAYVLKNYRNQGIGSLLYKDVVEICKKKGIKQIMLDVYTINKKSAKFHEKRGFKPFVSIFSKYIK